MISSIRSIISSVTSSISVIKPLKTIALLGFKLFLYLGLVCVNFYTNSGIATAASLPQKANIQTIIQTNNVQIGNTPITIAQASPQLDIDRAAEKADQASDNIYEGLDTTKRIIGKTDKRNQVIEAARDHASQKWKSLADKAKAAQNSDTSLTPTEEQVLKQVED